MSFNVVAKCILVIFISLVNGMPQRDATAQEKTDDSLPFLQFTNGGIRVNFGGYHAEAGLGGLLRGTGGGLHVSAGTPWGAHAGAGLGGRLGAEDGNLGGGLYARAGLGRGGPEAAAGLGGRLDGSGRSANPIAGGLYAGATRGGPGTGVFLGGGVDQAGFDGLMSGSAVNGANLNAPAATGATTTAPASADAAATRPKSRTNIQIIPSKKQKENEKVAEADATVQADAPASEKAESQSKETRRAVPYVAAVAPAAEVGLVKSVYVGAAPAVKTIVVPVPTAAVAAQGAGQVAATADTVATVANPATVVVAKPVYPRWHFRKRFRTVPVRKTVYVAPTAMVDSQGSPSDVVDELFVNSVGGGGGAVAASKTYVSGSLFDDIFNIPISTLSAVNQLLRNNVVKTVVKTSP